MKFQISDLWSETDKTVHMMTNFTNVRFGMEVTDKSDVMVVNETYLKDTSEDGVDLYTGDNVLYNATEVREF